MKNRVSPALAEFFDQEVSPDEIWRINTLSIDLGEVHENISDRELAERIVRQVSLSLEKYRASANGHLEKIPVEVAELDALVFYLINGHLPEGALVFDVTEAFKKHTASKFVGFLALLYKQAGDDVEKADIVSRRLAWQFPEKDLYGFLEKYVQENQNDTLDWIPVFYKNLASLQRGVGERLKEHFWIAFFQTVLTENSIKSKEFGALFYRNFLLETGPVKMPKNILDTVPVSIVKHVFLTSIKRKKEKPEKIAASSSLSEGIFCANAGVILLHPFLPTFFQTIGLIGNDGKSFKNEEKRGAAIYWLHYLATRNQHAAEPDLALMKFLCGHPIAIPVRQPAAFKKEHQTEAEALLASVINHWVALKNTSPDGLREGFLQRQGRLTSRQNGILLEMESKTQDILLGQLPWGLSVVQLPWLDAPFWVQWG